MGAIKQLQQTCRVKNERCGITGALYYDGSVFFQTLEGKHEDLSALLEKIGRDQRHVDFQIISDVEIDTRVFTSWSMKFVSGMLNPTIAVKFSYTALLDAAPSDLADWERDLLSA